MTDPRHAIGANNPPMAPEDIKAQLASSYADLLSRFDELGREALQVPAKIESDEVCGHAQDLAKMLRVAITTADSSRKIEKEPWANAGKAVDAFFKVPIDIATKVQSVIMESVTRYLDAKKEAERREREAKAQREREELARLEREREESARKEREARAAAEKAEREAEEARRAKARALAEAAEAEARAKRFKEQERLAKLQLDAGVEQHKKRVEAMRLEREEAEEQAAKSKAEARAAREVERTHTKDARALDKEATASAREGVNLEKAAAVSGNSVARAERKAEAGDAELSRTRGDLGTVGSLAQRWSFRIINREQLRPEALWPFFSEDEINAAVGRAVRSGVRSMSGVVIERVSEARIV